MKSKEGTRDLEYIIDTRRLVVFGDQRFRGLTFLNQKHQTFVNLSHRY
jgi:hypothetical protein